MSIIAFLLSGGIISLVFLLAFLLKMNPYDLLITLIAIWVLSEHIEKIDEKED